MCWYERERERESESLSFSGWCDQSVEWAGVAYSKAMPKFDVSKEALEAVDYQPNHALWLVKAASLAYRTPPEVKHVVTKIWGTTGYSVEECDSENVGRM